MARRPDPREAEMLSKENLKELRHNLAHLSLPAVRDFYEQAYRDCRLIYDRLPSPRQMQTLVQVWKQLWKWRSSAAPSRRLLRPFSNDRNQAISTAANLLGRHHLFGALTQPIKTKISEGQNVTPARIPGPMGLGFGSPLR